MVFNRIKKKTNIIIFFRRKLKNGIFINSHHYSNASRTEKSNTSYSKFGQKF